MSITTKHFHYLRMLFFKRETMYNFDEVIDRHHTDCSSIEMLTENFGRPDISSFWIADMDFRTPDFIVNSILKRCEHEIFGYTAAPPRYYQAIINWVKKRHGLSIEREHLGYLPGVVPGLAHTLNTYTKPGDGVMIQPPVYAPFFSVIKNNERKVIANNLTLGSTHFEIDWENFEKGASQSTLFYLCNPHNPGGRVWTRAELERLATICEKHNVIVVSDEIHCDLTLSGYKHATFAGISDWARNNSITLMASTKTFNMAGLASAFCFIPNKDLYQKMHDYVCRYECIMPNIFAFESTTAAFEKGEPWLSELLKYIESNITFTTEYLQKHIPQVKVVIPQATYLMWLDFRALNLSQEGIKDLIINKALLALNDGSAFGTGGEGFMRLNLARPRSVIAKALEQLKRAID